MFCVGPDVSEKLLKFIKLFIHLIISQRLAHLPFIRGRRVKRGKWSRRKDGGKDKG